MPTIKEDIFIHIFSCYAYANNRKGETKMGITVYVGASGKLTVRLPISKLADKESLEQLSKTMQQIRNDKNKSVV